MIKEREDSLVDTVLQDTTAGRLRQRASGIEAEVPVDVHKLEGLMQDINDMQQTLAA